MKEFNVEAVQIEAASALETIRRAQPAYCMRTLPNVLKYMNEIEIFRILEKYTMYPPTLCKFT
jgi:hypothetical protein